MSHPSPSPALNAPSRLSNNNLLELFVDQLVWLIAGAHEAKRSFTRWLLLSPPPPSEPAVTLSQARRITTRHLNQLDQLLAGLPLPVSERQENRAIARLLEQGEDPAAGAQASPQSYTDLVAVLQRVSSCFATACSSAGETAIVLGRVDLAAVLASWAAAWRHLQQSLSPGTNGLPPAALGVLPEER